VKMSISNGLPGLLASVAASVPGRPAVVAAEIALLRAETTASSAVWCSR